MTVRDVIKALIDAEMDNEVTIAIENNSSMSWCDQVIVKIGNGAVIISGTESRKSGR